MKSNIKIFTVLLFTSLSLNAFSQNLSPVVEVRKAYKAKLLQIKKPELKMAIPDSVLKFDLEFDYDSYKSTYKTPYDFKPYLLNMEPEAEVDQSNSLYLKVGAGYTLHPYLDFIWSPKLKGAFKMNVYAGHHSYFGNYVDALNINIKPWTKDTPKFSGYNARSIAGVDAGFDWEKASLIMNFEYDGLAQKDNYKKREFNALDASIRVFSRSIKPNRMHYDFGIDYKFGKDKLAYFDRTSLNNVREHNFSFYMSMGPVVRTNHKLLIDAGFEMAAYKGMYNSSVGYIYLTPKYIYEKGRIFMSAGVRTTLPFKNDITEVNHQKRPSFLYPDFSFIVNAIENALDFYILVKGGNDINTYSSIINKNNFFDPNYGVLNNNVERISSALGFKGRISSRFSYDLRGGYAYLGNSLEDALFVSDDGLIVAPKIDYINYNKAFAALDLYFRSKSIDISSSTIYTYTDITKKDKPIFTPSAIKGNANITYNWRKRIYTGVDCEYATSRQTKIGTETYKISGYADLGLYLEYRSSTKLSFWVRGGNLLFMNIQKSPFYAEKGANFTAGICLNL